jgi:tripartite-type tricarboxylate transporter receptor subunit TctC
MRLTQLMLVATTCVACCAGGPIFAQDYPNRPVRIFVPFAAGGSVDLLARVVGNRLSEQLKQPVVIENRMGAGGNIAADLVAKSAPDGYTILQTTVGQAIAPAIFRKLPFDPVNDFVPVTQLTSSTLILVASPHLPMVKSITDLVAFAKARPGTLNYGMSGAGNPLHLTMEMIKVAAGLDIVGVPYKADAPIMAALISGEVHVAVVPLSMARPLVENGQIRALGVTGTRRSVVLPDVPTISETVGHFESSSWQGWFAPAKTPRGIVDLLAAEAAKALATPEVRERLREWVNEPVGSTPAEFETFFRAEVAKFARVVNEAHIPLQD